MVVLCLSNAALMIAVGLLGEYVAKIFEESKARPLYVVADTWNLSPRVVLEVTGAEAQLSGARNGILLPEETSVRATSEVVKIRR